MERKLDAIRTGLKDASFAYGRRNAINRLMHHRCGGECVTDDAETFIELLVPFLVEAAYLHKSRHRERYPRDEVFNFLRAYLPAYLRRDGVASMIDALVDEAFDARARAVEIQERTGAAHPEWLPTMDEMVRLLRVTREEVRFLDLRGWGCIDPLNADQRRQIDRDRKRAERAAKGATPREKSTARTKPWEAAGMSRATWYRQRGKSALDAPPCETLSSGPYLSEYGADEFVSLPDFMIPVASSGIHAQPV